MGNLCSVKDGYISVCNYEWTVSSMTKEKYGFKPKMDKSNVHESEKGHFKYHLPEGYSMEEDVTRNGDHYVIWTPNKEEIAFFYMAYMDYYATPHTRLTYVIPEEREKKTNRYKLAVLKKGGDYGP